LLAEEIEKATGVQVKLVPDKDGVFDVFFDDSLVFSISDQGRFPQPGEIAGMLIQ